MGWSVNNEERLPAESMPEPAVGVNRTSSQDASLSDVFGSPLSAAQSETSDGRAVRPAILAVGTSNEERLPAESMPEPAVGVNRTSSQDASLSDVFGSPLSAAQSVTIDGRAVRPAMLVVDTSTPATVFSAPTSLMTLSAVTGIRDYQSTAPSSDVLSCERETAVDVHTRTLIHEQAHARARARTHACTHTRRRTRTRAPARRRVRIRVRKRDRPCPRTRSHKHRHYICIETVKFTY